jgi:hypothetical protein
LVDAKNQEDHLSITSETKRLQYHTVFKPCCDKFKYSIKIKEVIADQYWGSLQPDNGDYLKPGFPHVVVDSF